MGDNNALGCGDQQPPAYWALPGRGHHREVETLVLDPTDNDVLLGRGRIVQQHVGNQQYNGKYRVRAGSTCSLRCNERSNKV